MKVFKSVLLITVCALLFMPSIVSAMSSAKEPRIVSHPHIIQTKGMVLVKGKKDSAWEEATEGMLLLSGDVLKTETGGFARIVFPSGVIEIYETTVLVIPSIDVTKRKKDIFEIIIEEGKTLFDINPAGVENGFEFRTKNVQGGVKGTLFTVSYVGEGTAVNVYEGVVEVSGISGSGETPVNLEAGRTFRAEEKGGPGKFGVFDPGEALRKYKENIMPVLDDETGLPAEQGDDDGDRSSSISIKGSAWITDNDQGSNDQGSNDQGEDSNDQGENKQ